MVNPFVERATSDKLIGPDWAMNVEICDAMNRDPGQVKDVIKGLKKRLKSKNPKVQGLALTLLDTLLKNCTNIVLNHILEKDIYVVLVKLGRKKTENSVADKLAGVFETWKEVYGNSMTGNPNRYAAHRDSGHAFGPVFTKKSDRSMPIYTTSSRTHPHASYPRNTNNTDSRREDADSSLSSEYPTLSLEEIQSVRALVDVLEDMLNALAPEDKETMISTTILQGLRQDVIVDLVGQSRSYKQRLLHLINESSDEELIQEGLTLNDDLHHILAKYETMVSGTPHKVEKGKTDGPLVDIEDLIVTTEDHPKLQNNRSSSSDAAANPAPPSNDSSAPMIDLLSGEDSNSPKAENQLALVPANEPQPTSPISHANNILALPDMFSQSSSTADSLNSQPNYPSMQTYSSASQFYGGEAQNGGALPRPPWETETTDDNQAVGIHLPQPQQFTQVGMYIQPITSDHLQNQTIQGNQLTGFPQGGQMMVIVPHQINGNQMAFINPQAMQNQQLQGYGYDQNQQVQYLNQRMYSLSVKDENTTRNLSSETTSYLAINRPQNPKDKLFGDLVDMAKLKPKNQDNDKGGNV